MRRARCWEVSALEARKLFSTVTWTGAAGTVNWNDAANWSSGALPVAADDVQIPATTPVTVSGGDVQITSLDGGELTVNSSLLISGSGSITSLALGATGHFGGTGDLSVSQKMPFNTGELVGPGSISFDGGLLFAPTTVSAARPVVNGVVLNASKFTFFGNSQVLMDDSAGRVPEIVISNQFDLPVNSGGFVSKGTAHGILRNDSSYSPVVNTTNGSGYDSVSDCSGLIYQGSGLLIVNVGTLKLGGGNFNRTMINDASVLEVDGDSTWTAAGAIPAKAHVNFVGGTHVFSTAAAITSTAVLSAGAGATLRATANQTLSKLSLDSATIEGVGATFSAATINATGVNRIGNGTSGTLTATGGETTVASAKRSSLGFDLTNATVHLGDAGATGLAPFAAGVVTLRGNAVIDGPGLFFTASAINSSSVANRIDGVVTANSCTLSSGSLAIAQLASISGGVFQSGTLSLGGELILGDAPAIVTNRGNITLTGPSGKLASLSTLSRNEGSLAVNGVRLQLAGDFVNVGTLTLGPAGGAERANPRLDVTGQATLGGSFVASMSPYGPFSASDEPIVLRAASIVGTFGNTSATGVPLLIDAVSTFYTPTSVGLHLSPRMLPNDPGLTAATDSGNSAFDRVTNLTSPTAQVDVTDVGTVQFVVDGNVVASAIVDTLDASGHAIATANLPTLTEGTHSYTVRLIDRQGVASVDRPAVKIVIDTVAPTFVSGAADLNTLPLKLNLTFDSVIGGNSAQGTYELLNLTEGGTTYPATLTASFPTTKAARLTFPAGYRLPDGRYRFTVLDSQIFADTAGNVPANASFTFSVLTGDANHDDRVDFADLVIVAQNYGLSGRNYSTGNFDYSANGKVDFADLVILAQHYNTSLPPLASSRSTDTTSTGKDRVAKDVLM